MHGIKDGKEVEECDVVNTIAGCLNPYEDEQWDELKKYAVDKEVRFIFSNTTEAGIAYVKEDGLGQKAPLSLSSKVNRFIV